MGEGVKYPFTHQKVVVTFKLLTVELGHGILRKYEAYAKVSIANRKTPPVTETPPLVAKLGDKGNHEFIRKDVTSATQNDIHEFH